MSLRRFKVLCQADPPEYQPATVHLRVVPKADGRSRTPPEIDSASGIAFKVWSCAENQQSDDYLQFSNQQVLGDRMTFTVEPNDKLLWRDNFDHVISDDFRVTVTVKVKGAKDGKGRPLSADFLVNVGGAPVIIHWQWSGCAIGYPMRSGLDAPIELQADGKSWFHLKVRAQEWDKKRSIWQDADTDKYEFTHWIARDDPSLRTSMFEADPPTWDDTLKGSTQAENDWYSRRELPSPPDFSHMPVKTDLDVKAFAKGTIQQRLVDDVLPHVSPLGEVLIPIHLVRYYTVSLAVYLAGDDKPLAAPVDVTVNGEKVKVYCPNLSPSMLPDRAPKLRWHIKWPGSVPPSKRNFRLTDQDDDLVRVTSPRDGRECLGVEISIVDDPCSDADPPVFLDVRAQELEIIVKFDIAPRRYAGVGLSAGEFVADSYDQMPFTAWIHEKGADSDKVSTLAIITAVKIIGVGSENYGVLRQHGFAREAVSAQSDEPPGLKLIGWVMAKKSVLYTPESERHSIQLQVCARTTGDAGVDIAPVAVSITPRFPYMKLWVVPGVQRGFSEAGVFVCLAPYPRDILIGTQLRLEVRDHGNSPALTLCSPCDQATGKDGTAQWSLEYRGLDWNNLDQAKFTVDCHLLDQPYPANPFGAREGQGPRMMSEPCRYEIDVAENQQEMLTDLSQAAGSLNLLRNVDFPYEKTPDLFARLRGPAWNAAHPGELLSGHHHNPWYCGSLRDRIQDWMLLRRTHLDEFPDPDDLARMNGIEVSAYRIGLMHFFAGYFLSGSSPENARMIDPWWRQEWGEFLTMTEEVERFAASVIEISALATIIVPILVKIGAAAAAAAGAAAPALLASALTMAKQWVMQIASRAAAPIIAKAIVGGGTLTVGAYLVWWGEDTGASNIMNGEYINYVKWLPKVSAAWRKSEFTVTYVSTVED